MATFGFFLLVYFYSIVHETLCSCYIFVFDSPKALLLAICVYFPQFHGEWSMVCNSFMFKMNQTKKQL